MLMSISKSTKNRNERRVKMEMVALMVVLAWFGIVGSWAADEV
jgi:hypothetical protein